MYKLSEYKERIPVIKCICPKCRVEHYQSFRWCGGNVIPRKYCDDCKELKRKTISLIDLEYGILYPSPNKNKRD